MGVKDEERPDVAQIRKLLVAVDSIARYLTIEEISDIGGVLLQATNRMLKEQGETP